MVRADNWQTRLKEVLRASPVFGLLDDGALDDLAGSLVCQPVVGGSLVLREGDSADSMIIVVSGRLRVWRRGGHGELLLYNEISPGESVGETGLILHQQRTANVTALRDSVLAVLARPAFEALLVKQPLAINRVFSQAIFNFLRHTIPASEQRKARSFVLVPLHAGAGAGAAAAELVKAFAAQGRADHLRCPSESWRQFHAASLEDGIGHLDELESRFDFLVYEADAAVTPWTRGAVRQSDQVIFVAACDAPNALTEMERLLADEPGFSMKRKHLVLLHPGTAAQPTTTTAWRGSRAVERVYPLRIGNAADFARLARFLTDSAIGLVLGGGGARGFAHLGVLKALEEAAIPVDLIGGNSMGALIGAQYAIGVPLDEIRERTRAFAMGGEFPTLPAVSLLSGRRLERDLRRMFGATTIDALWRPFFAAACNLSRACTTVQDSGYLWQAVLASNSPAGLLPPVVRNGDLLVDGAILDNVPVAAMRARLGTPLEQRRGNGSVIAVDVDVRDDLGVDPGLGRLSVWGAIKGYLGTASQRQPGIGDILYRAGHIGGLHQRARTVAMADFYLEPPVAGFALMAYRQAAEIAEVGYRYAAAELQRWHRQRQPLH
jgi:NTE family protein/lysophospholipid hydrolase